VAGSEESALFGEGPSALLRVCCGASDRARAKRPISGLATANNPLETRMSIDDFYAVSAKTPQGVEMSML